jgi:hypothetical protein
MLKLICLLFIFLIFFIRKYEYFPIPHMSPPKRNVSYDLRCDPYIPKRNLGPWRQSTIDYYHRPKCLVQL